MNRPIKFRAWDKQNSKFYAPTHEAYKGNLFELMIGFGGDLLAHYMEDDSDGVKHESVFSDRFILMQFTGLTDKNGKEIYEGDIVKWFYGDYAEPSISTVDYNAPSFDVPDTEVEVIGNIFENPELGASDQTTPKQK